MWNGKGFPPVGTVCEVVWGERRTRCVVTSHDNGICVAECEEGTAYSPIASVFTPIKTEWNGKGFPPVGTVCEFKYIGIWMKGEVTTSDKKSIGVSNGHYSTKIDNLSLVRPIKSTVEVGDEQFDWNGEGFPPAGVKCEVLRNGTWWKAFIVGFDQYGLMVFSIEESAEFYCTQLTEHFRPLRTERQIAQQEMAEIYKANSTASLVELFGLIHDAGVYEMPEVRHLEVITGWVSVKPNDTNIEIEIDNIDGSYSAFLTREQTLSLRDILEDLLK